MQKTKLVLLLLASCLVFTGCSGLSPADKERLAVYEQQKKREQADRAQRETDAAGKRLDKVMDKY